ncbi:hypothetical protein CR51_18290 [Caballeronia megalochromosomata]|nr:hypothetical protein CR51_18290 [Caballeronia megalochromosomata]
MGMDNFVVAGTEADLFDPIYRPLPILTGRQAGFWRRTDWIRHLRPFPAFALPLKSPFAAALDAMCQPPNTRHGAFDCTQG